MKVLTAIMLKTTTATILTSLAILAVPASSTAEEIRLDFNESSGFGESSGNWNNFNADDIGTNATLSNLIDFPTGTPTGIDVTTANMFFVGFNSALWSAGTKDWMEEIAGDDAIVLFSNGTTGTISFSNLTGAAYRVEVVGSVSNPAGLADYSVNGLLADDDFDGNGENGDNYATGGVGHDNWLIWNSIVPSAGAITIAVTDVLLTGQDSAVVNAVRLTLVPEPSTLTLLALALVGLLAHGRRRRA